MIRELESVLEGLLQGSGDGVSTLRDLWSSAREVSVESVTAAV